MVAGGGRASSSSTRLANLSRSTLEIPDDAPGDPDELPSEACVIFSLTDFERLSTNGDQLLSPGHVGLQTLNSTLELVTLLSSIDDGINSCLWISWNTDLRLSGLCSSAITFSADQTATTNNDICMVCSLSWSRHIEPRLDGHPYGNFTLDHPSLIVRVSFVAPEHLEEVCKKTT